MNIGTIKVNKVQLIVIAILLIGLLIAVYLVQTKQIFKSKAGSDVNDVLNVTDSEGNPLQYQGNGVYKTNSLDVQVGVKNPQ